MCLVTRNAFVRVIGMSLVLHASASLATPAPAVPAEQPPCQGGLKFATGPAKKGYANLFRDIRAVCGKTVPMCEVRSSGGLDNLDILSNKKADVGLAQLDTIREMSGGNESIAALQAVAVMNSNFLHVLTARDGYTIKGERKWGVLPGKTEQYVIRNFSDLKGRNVALVGSAQLLGRALGQRQFKDYNMHFVDASSDKEAFEWARTGQVQAVFTVGGVPHGAVSELKADDRLTLVPFDVEIGGLYSVRKINYKNLGVYNRPALAVQNVLLTRPFGPAKAAQIAELRQCIADQLVNLRDGEYERAWDEVSLDAKVELPRFTPPATAGAGAAPRAR